MALGRIKEDNLIKRKLKAHNKRMKVLIELGYSRERASKIAFSEIKGGLLKY